VLAQRRDSPDIGGVAVMDHDRVILTIDKSDEAPVRERRYRQPGQPVHRFDGVERPGDDGRGIGQQLQARLGFLRRLPGLRGVSEGGLEIG